MREGSLSFTKCGLDEAPTVISTFDDSVLEAGGDRVALRRLGIYSIHRVLGRGGFGVVYLAYDPVLDSKVALKVLAPHLALQPEFVERFRREAKSVARLRHPNVVSIIATGEEQDIHYLVMEYVKGWTLKEILAESALDHALLLSVFKNLARGLAYAHGRGVIHRDLKPANIIVENMTGRAVITDFGLARMEEGGETLTRSDTLLGTPAYMSPEQALHSTARVDCRSDLYSLGVVLYKSATGEVPFRGETPMAILKQVIDDDPIPPSEIVQGLPGDLEAIILKAMAKDRSRRYQTAKQLLADLVCYGEGKPLIYGGQPRASCTQAPSSPSPLKATTIASPRRVRWLNGKTWAAVAALVVILAGMPFAYRAAVVNASAEIFTTALRAESLALDALANGNYDTSRRQYGSVRASVDALAQRHPCSPLLASEDYLELRDRSLVRLASLTSPKDTVKVMLDLMEREEGRRYQELWDFEVMCERGLGNRWKDLGPKEKDAVVMLVRSTADLFIKEQLGRALQATKITTGIAHVEDEIALVDVRILVGRMEVQMILELLRRKGMWKVVDMSSPELEGISMTELIGTAVEGALNDRTVAEFLEISDDPVKIDLAAQSLYDLAASRDLTPVLGAVLMKDPSL